MKKLLCLLLCIAVLIMAALPVSAGMTTDFHVQLVYVTGTTIKVQHSDDYQDLENAVKNAASGSIIEVYGDITVSSPVVIPSGLELVIVSGTKRESNANFGASSFVDTDQGATTRNIKKNFDGSLFTLGENSRVTFENIVLDGNGKSGAKGGLVYAKSGAAAIFRRGVTLRNAKLGDNSFGGAVFAEKNAAVSVENTVFSGNDATAGKDIFLKCNKNFSLSEDVTAAVGVCGDVNGDFKVDIKDLVRLKKIFAGVPDMKVENCSSDVSCDGAEDGGDLAELKTILLTYY